MRRCIIGRIPSPGFIGPPPCAGAAAKDPAASGKKRTRRKKEAGVKPQGPLIISVSIGKQRVKVYDAHGVFAEAPVHGHGGPFDADGVFSVIQKHKLHHSNIYSNAPMPYMQRITWSGVACTQACCPAIRIAWLHPDADGLRGEDVELDQDGRARCVTPGETTPASFSHPLLPAFKVAPQPVVAEQPLADAPVAAKADKGAPETKPATSLELRSTVGHRDAVTRSPK